MRVLVIEDDRELAEADCRRAASRRLAVDVAFDGADGLERRPGHDYDVIVLDRDLPGMHGDEVCGRLIAARRAGAGC